MFQRTKKTKNMSKEAKYMSFFSFTKGDRSLNITFWGTVYIFYFVSAIRKEQDLDSYITLFSRGSLT